MRVGTAQHLGRRQREQLCPCLVAARSFPKGEGSAHFISYIVGKSVTQINRECVVRWRGNLLHPHCLHTDTLYGVFHCGSGTSCRPR